MSFRSKSVEATGANSLRIHGDLTLHGVHKAHRARRALQRRLRQPPLRARARIGFSASGKFKRSDFGVSYGLPEPGTTMGVGDEVQVVLETEFSGPAARVAAAR